MTTFIRFNFLFIIIFFIITSLRCAHKSPIMVDGNVALSSLIALSDGHLIKLRDELSFFAKSSEASLTKWEKVRSRLAEIEKNNIAAVIWFALPDGSYWTVDAGKVSGNLLDRPYWNNVMKGQTVVGDLVVSKSTGQNVAIIAVPLLRSNKSVAGVFGASVYLDKLSLQLKREMAVDSNYIFYAIDSAIRGALNSNTSLIFTYPKELTPEMAKVFDDMVTRSNGVARYNFNGGKRTVLYKKSSAVGWWYAFGVVEKD